MENYTISTAVRRMSEHMANLYYYITKTMVDSIGLEVTTEVMKKAMISFGHARGAAIAEKVLADGKELTIENLDAYYDIPITDGWDPQRHYIDGRKENTTKSCSFADVWIEKDWCEIGHIYCLVDIAIREGYNKHVIFKPQKNILKGDGCCTSVTIYE